MESVVHRFGSTLLMTMSILGTCMFDAPIIQAEAKRAWTMVEVEEHVVRASPRMRNAMAQLEVAKSHMAFARLPVVRNPVISVRAMIGWPDAPAATYAALVGLPFDVSGKRRAWSREVNALVAQAQAELSVARNEALADARRAYVLVASGDETQRVLGDSVENALGVLQRVKARFDANAATTLDVALAEREHGEALADLARARRDRVDAAGLFRQVLDLNQATVIEVAPLTAPVMPDGLSIEEAVARAVSHRREIAALENGVERLRRSDVRLRKEAVGPLQLNAEAEAQGNQNTMSTGGGSMSFDLPLFFRNQGERAVAKGKARALEVERELMEHGVARQAAVSLRTLEASLAEFEAIEQQASEAADRALAMTMEMLEAGAVDYFYLLTARRSAFQLRTRRVSSLRTAWLARIELERAVGGLSN